MPADRVAAAGFEPVDRIHRTRFDLPTATVREHTRLYADPTLDDARHFFFATALSFDPPLAPVVGAASVRPAVTDEARRSFVRDLRERGVEDAERTRTERLRTETGDRARLTGYRGWVAVDGERVDVAGWIGVWTTGGEFRLAGGGYPETPPPGRDYDPTGARDALFDLLRVVR